MYVQTKQVVTLLSKNQVLVSQTTTINLLYGNTIQWVNDIMRKSCRKKLITKEHIATNTNLSSTYKVYILDQIISVYPQQKISYFFNAC